MTATAATEKGSGEELEKRQRRKDAYHFSAGRNRLPVDVDEKDFHFRFLVESKGAPRDLLKCKANLIRELAVSRGNSDTPEFTQALEELTELYDPSQLDVHDRKSVHLGGMWLTLTKPKYPDCLGLNSNDEYMYTLGRMSFGMFQPSSLICSIQGTFNPVHYVSRRDREAIRQVPESLRAELKQGKTVLRTYNIVTAFSIEPRTTDTSASENRNVPRPIKALMTTNGYALPDPEKPNRLSIWFTEGCMELNESADFSVWESLFPALPAKKGKGKTRVSSGVSEKDIKMECDGKMCYTLNSPVGGHGVAYVDILYLDETLRVVRGSAGDVVVFARVPHFPDE